MRCSQADPARVSLTGVSETRPPGLDSPSAWTIIQDVDTATAELALEAARRPLQEAGNPSYLAVAVHRDGTCALAPFVMALPAGAVQQAGAMADDASTVLIVCRQEADERARFTVLDATGRRTVLRRIEMADPAGGWA